ncbi:unnamed protein product [Adineta steineri]|uniref:LTD domain-containing protein n=1 Tax=Adineta steineri TaxID=433720 RepID=A0A813W3D1_9BILA|nr:unnamed protein product [Adineta steineri]
MDMKQNHHGINSTVILDGNSIHRLIQFVHNLEEKLLSVKTTHEQLHELMTVVSKTHETIVDELTTIKMVLNEKQNQNETSPVNNNYDEEEEDEEEDEEIEERHTPVSIKQVESKSLTNLSSTNRPIEQVSLCSSSTNSLTSESRTNSSTIKRSSSLKKSEPRIKSAKSVSFNFNENKDSQPSNIEKPSTESNETFEELTTSVIPYNRQNSDLMPDLFKQHHKEITNKPTIGYKMGSALVNIRIHEIEPTNGEYLRLLNISNSDDYDLGGHFLQQNIACAPVCRFRFPYNTIIRAGQTVTVWCGALRDIEPQPPHLFVWKDQRRWETGPECVTILAKPNGQAIAWARSSRRVNSDQSSSDILFVQTKNNNGLSDVTSLSGNGFKNRSRLSAFNFIGKDKPPFAHSPSSPVHPDYNGVMPNVPNDLRSQMHQRNGLSQLLVRPKSSPFAGHSGCKQDLISMNFLRNQQTQEQKQTSVKT